MGKFVIPVLDDIGFAGIGAFASILGITDPPLTPVMDSLASSGIKFTQCRVMPSCSPTRVAMLTGQYPHRSGVWVNVSSNRTLPDGTEPFAPLDFPSHKTGLIGKMHMGNFVNGLTAAPLDPGDTPAGTMGFNEYKGPFFNITGATLLGDDQTYFNFTEVDPRGVPVSPHLVDVGIPDEVTGEETAANYATTRTVDDAIAFIQGAAGDWICNVNFNAPHFPVHVPPVGLLSAATLVRRAAFLEAPARAAVDGVSNAIAFSRIMTEGGVPISIASNEEYIWQAIRMAMEAIDTELGRLFAIPEINFATDTTAILLGDNGPQVDFVVKPEETTHSKGTTYDTGTRVPLIVRGSAVGDTGECTGLVNAVDIWETIADIESVARSGTRDGNSFKAALADVDASTGRDYSLSEVFSQEGIIDFGTVDPTHTIDDVMQRALTDGTHKLIRIYDMTTLEVKSSELYNIVEDPFETNNLLIEGSGELFESCKRGCQDYAGLRRLQREFLNLSPGI